MDFNFNFGNSALVSIEATRLTPGEKSLSDPMIDQFITYVHITVPKIANTFSDEFSNAFSWIKQVEFCRKVTTWINDNQVMRHHMMLRGHKELGASMYHFIEGINILWP